MGYRLVETGTFQDEYAACVCFEIDEEILVISCSYRIKNVNIVHEDLVPLFEASGGTYHLTWSRWSPFFKCDFNEQGFGNIRIAFNGEAQFRFRIIWMNGHREVHHVLFSEE